MGLGFFGLRVQGFGGLIWGDGINYSEHIPWVSFLSSIPKPYSMREGRRLGSFGVEGPVRCLGSVA